MNTISPTYLTPLFITGIGTGVGKTLVSAIVTEALGAHYWKPVQAGFDEGTDSEWVAARITNSERRIHPETYKLALPASPHIAARQEDLTIDLDRIAAALTAIQQPSATTPASTSPSTGSPGNVPLIIEGAGGLLVPLTPSLFVLDLIKKLDARVILVSRNYLGSINHSLLTAEVCKAHGLKVAGWIFNDQYLHYEQEIATWTGLPVLASIPHTDNPDATFVWQQAARIRPALLAALT